MAEPDRPQRPAVPGTTINPRRPPRASGWSAHWLGAATCAALIALHTVTGAIGQDTLRHWDEETLVNKVRWSVENGGTLLPGQYAYPSVDYWIALACLAPDLWSVAGEHRSAAESMLVARLDAAPYRLRLRRAFLFVAALAVLWTYVALLGVGLHVAAAVFGAALVATSWQVAYHARWPAPDGLVMQFVALALAFAAFAYTWRRRSLWNCAALAAGLAAGAKYSAWPLAPLVAIAGAIGLASSPRRRVIDAAQLLALAVVAFLISTPGAIFQPVMFATDTLREIRHYATGHSVAHTIEAGLPHLIASAVYLAVDVWAPHQAVSGAITALAGVGALVIVGRQPLLAVLLVGFPLVYVAYLSMQRVMIVRNLQMVIPPLAMLAAVGIAWLAGLSKIRWLRSFVALLAGTVVAVNARVLIESAASRQRADRSVDVAGLIADVRHGRFASPCATSSVFAAIAATGQTAPPALQGTCIDASHVVFMRSDTAESRHVRITRHAAVYAPREVDYTYYPDWSGYEPILVATSDDARALGVQLP